MFQHKRVYIGVVALISSMTTSSAWAVAPAPCTTSTASASNLVTNGTFSSSSGWAGLSGAGWGLVPLSGACNVTGAARNQWANPSLLNQSVTLSRTGTYTLSFQVYGTATFTPTLNGSSVGGGVVQNSNSWSNYSYTTSSLSAGSVLMQFGGGTGGIYYLSDVNLALLAPAANFTQNSSIRSVGAGAVLDALGGGTGNMAAAITALGALTSAQQTAALEKLTISPSRATQVAISQSMLSAFNQVGNRLDGLRFSENNFGSASLASTGAFNTGLSSGDEVAKHGYWFKTYGLEGTQGMKDGFAGYKSKGWGVALGADQEFAPGQIGGVSLSYSDTALVYRDQLDGNSSRAQSAQISVYGSQTIGTFYIDGMLAYAQQKNSSRRDTTVSGFAYGKFNGDQWGARVGAGMPIALSRDTTITPLARVEWNQVKQNGYTETDSALALSVNGNTSERIRSSLGAQVHHDTTIMGVKAQPFARAFWNYDFKNSGVDSVASFVGGGAAFTTLGQALDRNTYSVGAGANLFNKGNFTATLAYDLNLGSAYKAHTGSASARWDF